MSAPIILTAEGRSKLEIELKNLKEVRRPEIIEKIEQAKELGDLSENAEYHDAKDQQGRIELRIREIEEIFRKAIVSEQTKTKDKITLGSKFIVKDAAGNKKEFFIVGFNEAAPAEGKISIDSPIGQAFMNAKRGEEVEFIAPRGKVVYQVVEIL
ncbi:MAG: Transcription elongation factor GreA [Parcubacteria group bacterium GW2011_GWC2_39_14]|nr:MAG: Transcription elongation factor GreA [Parcubacteria group bacterium GW2011_GWC2_39_14]KKR55374.1 MAG: Transcription elongation factor GreA [Parcubacteria group bacterium GW2011_GWA2_40_23]